MGFMWWRLLLLGLLTYGWFCVCVDFLALLFVVGIAVAFMLCCARGLLGTHVVFGLVGLRCFDVILLLVFGFGLC